MTDAYFLYSTTVWPMIIKDRETLKKLYVFVFGKIADLQIYLFDVLRSIKIGNHGDMSDIIIPSIEARLNMTSRLNRCIDAYAKLDMQNELEVVIDSLWKIGGSLRYRIYPEPLIFGWNFDYGSDDWRKLFKIQKEHPEQTYENYVYNSVKSSAFSELDDVKTNVFMKLVEERDVKNKENNPSIV
jgi:hypothetical protein